MCYGSDRGNDWKGAVYMFLVIVVVAIIVGLIEYFTRL